MHYAGAIEPARRSRQINWQYAQVVLSSRPAYYWRLDELSGTTAVDQAGAANGTYTGGYTLGAPGGLRGETSTGVALNGSSGYVACGTLNLSVSALSMECWCYPTAFDTSTSPFESTMIGCGNGANQVAQLNFGDWAMVQNNAKPRFTFHNGVVQRSIVWPSQLPTATWYHVVGTYNGSTLRLYVNGIAATPVSANGSVSANWATDLGRYASARYFTGILDEAAIYLRALSEAEVLDHYRAGSRVMW